MVMQSVAALLIASTVSLQMPAPPPAPQSSIPASQSAIFTVPQGTPVPLTLITPIRSKTTRPGDSVRAQVAFPITIGSQVAIPAGTWVEGIVNQVILRAPHTHLPAVKIHFTRLLFANGYSVPLDAINSEARLAPIPLRAPDQAPGLILGQLADARDGAPAFAPAAVPGYPTNPQLPPLPSNGPSQGAIIGIAIGGAAATILLALAMTHHNGHADAILFDNGWQFQMVLQSPLTLNPDRISAVG